MSLKIILGVLVAGYAGLKAWWAKVSPILTPIVLEAEQMALDGKIDAADRKKLVMDTIAAFQANGTIKLNWIEMLVIGKIVDIIAQKLPDFIVSQNIKDVVAKVMPK